MKVGVLALQGGFALHQARLAELGCDSLRIVSAEDLSNVDSLVLPGGESSTLLKLCPPEFRAEICRRAESGMPILATCAGLIFLARHVSNPEQESLNLIDVDVRRNAYGRQKESFISRDIQWTDEGERLISSMAKMTKRPEKIEGVFIRAPQITAVGAGVQVLLELNGEGAHGGPIFVRQKNRFAATFHPELSRDATVVHEIFLKCE